MIKAIAIDDEPPALKVVELFCKQVPFIELEKTFTGPNEAAKHLKKFPTDLLFLDINMPTLNGIDLYKSVTQNTMVIFTTAYSDYAIESYRLNAIDYLLKPFTFERFEQAVNKAKDHHQMFFKQNELQYLFVRADYSLLKITISNILYIEALDDYLKIHQHNQKPIVARMTMKAILEKLPVGEFVRVHRSFIVPFNKIESIRNKVITIAGNEITIGSSYESDFLKQLKH